MQTITRLPSRPLRQQDLAALDAADSLQVVPYGGVVEGEETQVYALKVATGGRAHALGFDDEWERWQRLATVEADDLAAADAQLDAVLDEWVQAEYGDRFEVTKAL